MSDLKIRPLAKTDLEAVKAFTDRAIGVNYYTLPEIEEIFRKSLSGSTMCSLVLADERGGIHGVRITYPPGAWNSGKGKGLHPEMWRTPLANVAYFQSIFVDGALTGQGWGKKMSLRALEILKATGARAVVCHSWVESPHNSSGRYLRDLGFESVQLHPLYWKDVDYECTRCGKPCVCTAEEMIKYL